VRAAKVCGEPRCTTTASRSDALPDAVYEDLELAVEADERFLACMMDVERRLIPVVRVEPPVSDHEVRHTSP
jgi:hypothetical protein